MRYVYKVTNLINGKTYIGQTKNHAQRKANHFYAGKRERKGKLYDAMRKHGIENFTFEVIESCDDSIIDEREIYWVSHYDSYDWTKGYNATRGGSGTPGYNEPKSPEHKAKIAEGNKTYWAENPDDERRQRLVEKNRSEESRLRSSKTMKRRWANPETSTVSAETRQKLSAAHKGRKYGTSKFKGTKIGPRETSHTCKVCQKVMKIMTSQHLKTHSMTWIEYRLVTSFSDLSLDQT